MYRFFILTRFNIRLWNKDKKGQPTLTDKWLAQRFELFEQFCLPSIKKQSLQNFKWIVLFDADTPSFYKEKIERYKSECTSFFPCFVPEKEGRSFVRIFKKCILQEIEKGDVIITTYLDNDDALRYDYVETIRKMAPNVSDKTFISFRYGLQSYTELNIATRVSYRKNHFICLVEKYENPHDIRTVFGYGSHINVGKYKGTNVLLIETPEKEEWLELVHSSNMDNDVRMTFDTHLITDMEKLNREYGIIIKLAENSRRVYYTRFLGRAFSEVFRHIRLRIFGRKW